MTHLIADQFRGDPRVHEARRLVLEALHDHQDALQGTRPPKPELHFSYEKLLETLSHYRGSPLWYPYVGSGIGRGSLVELADGSIKYDFTCGVGVHFGHSLSEIINATFDAALDDLVLQGNLQQNRESAFLMEELTKASGLDHCFLTTSGAMAGENALKIAFQARSPRARVLTFANGFMGRTLALSQITDRPLFREGLPLNLAVDYLPFFDADHPEESLQLAMQRLEEHLSRYPDTHAALVFEVIQGEGGCYPGHSAFFTPILKRVRDAGIVVIVDEVQSFGRSPQLFAHHHFGLNELVDIAMIGKMAQVCATLFRKELNPKPGLITQTFTSSTAAIRTCLAILHRLQSGDFFGEEGRNATLHRQFVERLSQIPGASGPFGLGTMIAFTPFNGERERVLALCQALFEAGVIAFPCGREPSRIRFLLPAAALTDADIEGALQIITHTMEEEAW